MFNICDISLFDFERSSIFSHITFRQFFISSISSTLVHLLLLPEKCSFKSLKINLYFSATLLQDS